jgi:hypothetical protein
VLNRRFARWRRDGCDLPMAALSAGCRTRTFRSPQRLHERGSVARLTRDTVRRIDLDAQELRSLREKDSVKNDRLVASGAMTRAMMKGVPWRGGVLVVARIR